MSLVFKRRMQERERKNGLADTFEVPNYFMPKQVDAPSPQQSTMHNAPSMDMNDVAYSIPAELPKDIVFESESQLKPTESQISNVQNLPKSQAVPSWSMTAENYQETGGNKDQTLISLPQGAYYDVPIIINPASYQQQQAESFNLTPQQHQQSYLTQQLPCTNIDCVHCKPASPTNAN